MIIISEVTGYGLEKGMSYNVIFEYDSVYEVRLSKTTTGCRNKEFFKVVSDGDLKRFAINCELDAGTSTRYLDCATCVQISPYCVKIDDSVILTFTEVINCIDEVQGV